MSGVPDFFYKEALRLRYVARSAFKLLQLQDKYKLIKPGATVLDLGCAPGAWLQVACQSLGPIKNGGVVVGIDLKKVNVPSEYCDVRVQTVSADVMNLPRDRIRSLSPKGINSMTLGVQRVLATLPVDNIKVKRRITLFSQKAYTEYDSVRTMDLKERGLTKGIFSHPIRYVPPVSGIKIKDAAISAELGMRALDLAVGSAALTQNDPEPNEETENSSKTHDDDGILCPGGNLVIKLLESEDMQEFDKICKPLFRKASWLRPKAIRPSSQEIYLICQGLHA